MAKRITPKSARAKIDFSNLEGLFSEASDNLKTTGSVNLAQIGIDWNPCVLKSKGGKIGYDVNHYSDENIISGQIRNVGRNEIGIEVYSGTVGASGLGNNDIIRYLSEAVNYASKLRIMENVTLLPAGETHEAQENPKESSSRACESRDVPEYQAFSRELIDMAERIHVARKDGSFGNYLVTEMPSGWIVAYSKNYGEGAYVVDSMETLLQDKPTIRKNGDAIRFRRDRRSGNGWMDRILDLIK